MAKKVPELLGFEITAQRMVQVRYTNRFIYTDPETALKLADALATSPDAVEAFCFVLRQAAQGCNAVRAQDKATLEEWIKTQPERP